MREFRSRVKAALRRAGMARRDRADDERPLEVHELRIDPAKRTVDVRGGDGRRPPSSSSRSSPRWPRNPGRVFTRDMLLTRIWGDSRVPRPAHDRRPHPPPAREARARRQGARSTCSPCAAWATASATTEWPTMTRLRSLRQPPRARCSSLIIARRDRDRLPRRRRRRWRTRLRDQKLDALGAGRARSYSTPISHALGRSPTSTRKVLATRVRAAPPTQSGARGDAARAARAAPQGLQPTSRSDSTGRAASATCEFAVALRGRAHGRVRRPRRRDERRPRRPRRRVPLC